MNKYILGTIVSIVIGAIGLGLLIDETLHTGYVGVNISKIPGIGIIYAFIFSAGVIAAIVMLSLNTKPQTVRK